jgi:hypothetical protein
MISEAGEGGLVAVVGNSHGFVASGEDTNRTDEMCEASAGQRFSAARPHSRGRRMARVRT